MAALVEAELRQRGLIGREEFYPGRPIIVTRNDRATELSNGDTGVVVGDAEGRRVWFPAEPGFQSGGIAAIMKPGCMVARVMDAV